MSLLERLLASRAAQALATVAGIGSIVALVALVLPTESSVVPWLAGTYLGLVGLGVLAIILEPPARKLRARFIADLAKALRDQTSSDLLQQPHPPDDVDPSETAYTFSAARYGIGYDDLAIECLMHLDGSATVTRTVSVEAFSQIEKLDTYLVIPEEPPEGQSWDIDLLEVRSLSVDMKVSLSEVLPAQGRLSALLELGPPLIKGQQVQYEMREELPPSLYAIGLTDEEKAKRKTPYDYFGWTISRPTRRLRLRVFFPERLRPEGHGLEVRYASAAPGIPSETYQLEEQGRLGRPSLDGPQAARFCLKLEVEYPMTGLVYILRWEPLTPGTGKRRGLPQQDHVGSARVQGTDSRWYNVYAIRNLLQDALSAQELRQFCGDRPTFEPVLDLFGPKFSKSEMVDTLLEYCQRRNLLPTLLSEVQKVNPRQYARYESDLEVEDSQ